MQNTPKQYDIAVDISGPYGSFAIKDLEREQILCNLSIKLEKRNNYIFFEKFFEELNKKNIGSENINYIYAGNGPGSFTGLRVALSFAYGINFEVKKSKIKYFYSAFPLISLSPQEKKFPAVLYPASNKSVYIFSVNKEQTNWFINKMELVDKESLTEILEAHDCLISLMKKNLKSIVPPLSYQRIVEPVKYPIEEVFNCNMINLYEDLEPIYMTPPAKTKK